MKFNLAKALGGAAVIVLLIISVLILVQTRSDNKNNGYALHRGITATVFWIGEPADGSNDNISNVPMAWDSNATSRFGGNDGPTKKDGEVTDVPRNSEGIITSFRPKHNPYYFALPAAEYNDGGIISQSREKSPWRDQAVGDDRSLFKGRWIRVTMDGKTIYAQWLDVGPNVDDDYDYVFGNGTQKPKNTFGLKAGLDLSPAAAITLGFNDDSRQVDWQFIEPSKVPNGPWKTYPAISNLTYWTD